jgi:uncharacterized membrane protein HdeD (DUF308 family)
MKRLKTWWFLSTAGLLFMAFGIFSFLNPWSAYVKLIKCSGITLILNGFLLMLASSLTHGAWKREKKWMFAESLLDLFFGTLMVFNPFLTVIALPFLIGYWLISIGIVKIITSLLLKKIIRGWGFILMIGVIACAFGLLITWFDFDKASDITEFFGVFSLMMGTLIFFDSFRFRNREETLNMMF